MMKPIPNCADSFCSFTGLMFFAEKSLSSSCMDKLGSLTEEGFINSEKVRESFFEAWDHQYYIKDIYIFLVI